jgi:hypothetical protein
MPTLGIFKTHKFNQFAMGNVVTILKPMLPVHQVKLEARSLAKGLEQGARPSVKVRTSADK